MSPRKTWTPAAPRVRAVLARTLLELGDAVREERTRRRWTLADVARRAGVSVSMVHGVEAGDPTTVEGYVRIALALGLEPDFDLTRAARRQLARDADPVHAAMAEVEAARIGATGAQTRIDEPYQHFQFAGRADLVAISPDRAAFLHVENRTRFPNIQEFAGAYNAKRAYLAEDVARRLGLPGRPGGFASVTHVVVALWSSEVLHILRIRESTFRAITPDPPAAFAAWWDGAPPATGRFSTLVVLDPLPGERRNRRRWIGLDDSARAEPRYRGYADALDALRRAGRV